MMFKAKLIGKDPMSGYDYSPEWNGEGIGPVTAIQDVLEKLERDGIEINVEDREKIFDSLNNNRKDFKGMPFVYERSSFSDPEGDFKLIVERC